MDNSQLDTRAENTLPVFDIYCDESCHIEHDHIAVMVVGAVWCPDNQRQRIGRDIRELKRKHAVNPAMEIKWSKISPAKQELYLDLARYFFSNPALRFRGVIIPDKSKLDHARFSQDHNIFYYKMFYQVLNYFIEANSRYRIFMDIKDSLGPEKIEFLRNVIHSANLDNSLIERIQHVRSHEVGPLQLTDLFIGAIAYAHRSLNTNAGKKAMVEFISGATGRPLIRSSPLKETKFNTFVWTAQEL